MTSIAQKITSEFKELAGGDYQTAMLYTALAGAVISDIVPTPAMAWAYYRMKALQKKKNDGQLSQKELEQEIGKAYAYALPAWWIGVFAVVHFNKSGFEDKAKLALMIVGGGAVVGALFKQYVKHLPQFNEEN